MTHTTRHPNRPNGLIIIAAVSCLFALGACGDDGDAVASASQATEPTTEPTEPTTSPMSAATTTAPTDTVGTTEAPATTQTTGISATTQATETSGAPTAPPTTGSEASIEPELCEPYLEVTAAFAGEPDPATIGALLDEVDATAPAEIAEPLAVLTGGARTVLETGDFTVFEGPDFNAAVVTADSWIFENCEFVTTAEITAVDYAYQGYAEEYPAGRTAITLVNEGVEAHELTIIRKNDGVELTLDELLGLPESEAETMTTHVGGVFVGPPGARGTLVVDLAPGSYLAVCNIRAGTTVADDGSFTEGTGAPHVMLGMSFEFSVA